MPSNSAPLDKLKSQLAQIDALIADGSLSGPAGRQAREGIESQIVAAVLGTAPDPATGLDATAGAMAPPEPRPSRRLVIGLTLFVLVFAGAGYGWLGDLSGWRVGPGERGAGAAGESADASETSQIQALVSNLTGHLKDKPDDAAGWTLLGRAYSAQGRYADALPAYRRALDLQPKNAQALADYADGLAMSRNRNLEGEPAQLIQRALAIDPDNIKALALSGTLAFNHAQYKEAIAAWDHAVSVAGPTSELANQLQGALAEARQRAGLPPVADATGGAPTAQASASSAAANPAASVSGRVSLAPGLSSQVPADATVYIFARASGQAGMPLAVLRKRVSDLPFDFSLDDSLAMSPAARLSSATQVVVSARISKTGSAMPSPGDWQVVSPPVALGTQGLKLVISTALR
jgi:cytochrome c-type biogenesis protein CcmH